MDEIVVECLGCHDQRHVDISKTWKPATKPCAACGDVCVPTYMLPHTSGKNVSQRKSEPPAMPWHKDEVVQRIYRYTYVPPETWIDKLINIYNWTEFVIYGDDNT